MESTFHVGPVPTLFLLSLVQTKMSWRRLLTVWDLRQPPGIKVQSCPVL